MRPNIRRPTPTEEPTVDSEGHTVCRWTLAAMLLLVFALWGLFLWAIWPA